MSQDRDNNFYQLPESDRDYRNLNCDPRAQYGGQIDPAAFDDLLKISAKRNVTVHGFVAEAGGLHIEDGIDLNNECRNIELAYGRVGAGRKGVAVTIKGGSCEITLRNLHITEPGRGCDIEIGNHSDQSWRKCQGIVLEELERADGRPVRVAWGRGDRPTIIGGNVQIAWGRTVLLHLYVYAKHYLPWIPAVAVLLAPCSLLPL